MTDGLKAGDAKVERQAEPLDAELRQRRLSLFSSFIFHIFFPENFVSSERARCLGGTLPFKSRGTRFVPLVYFPLSSLVGYLVSSFFFLGSCCLNPLSLLFVLSFVPFLL